MTTLSDYTVEEEGARGSPTNNGYQLPTKRHDSSDSSNKQSPTSTSPRPSSDKKQKHLETRDRDPYKDPPELERELTLDELKSRLDDVLRYRRILKFSLWTIVIGIIIYGAFNVTSFVEQHGINWPLSLLLPLIIDTGLCISLWSDRLLYEYMMKDRWVSGLRWTTGLITWGLNIGGSIIVDPDGGGPAVPQMLPDWVGIIVHSVGPVFLIVVSETTASMTRRVSSILRLISEKKNEQLTYEQEYQDAYDELSRQLEETKKAHEEVQLKEQNLTDQLELSEQKSEQRLAETERIASIYTGTLPNHLPLGSGIGQSIVSSFLERFNQEGVFSLTSADPQTGYSAVDTLSPRCYIVKASDDELFLIDTRNPRVERILESSKGNIHYSDIPSDLFIIMRNSDIEKEAYNLILKNDFDGDRSEFSSMVRCYGAGTMEGISNETVLRLVIRAGISTGKLKQSYNTGHQAG